MNIDNHNHAQSQFMTALYVNNKFEDDESPTAWPKNTTFALDDQGWNQFVLEDISSRGSFWFKNAKRLQGEDVYENQTKLATVRPLSFVYIYGKPLFQIWGTLFEKY